LNRVRFAVLRLSQMPSVLIEGGFMTERGESRMIAKPEWRSEFARAISIGIESYRALAERKLKPLTVAEYRKQGKTGVELQPGPTAISLLAPTRDSLSLVTPPSPPPIESPSPGESATPTPPDEPPAAPAPSESPAPTASPSAAPSASPAPTDPPAESPEALSLRVATPKPSPTPLEIRP